MTANSYRVMEDFRDALADLQQEQPQQQGHEDAIKRRVSAAYDFTADPNKQFSLCWNWGMQREELHRELQEKVSGFDAYDSDGFSEQLYYYAFRSAGKQTSAKRRVLEVGCGLGSGLNFLSRLEPRNSYVGLDLSTEAIQIANSRLSRAGLLTFVQGDAEALPFPDAEFDVVLNIESSHVYPNIPKFFQEAARVLKPGGCLVHADVVTKTSGRAIERARQATHDLLQWESQEDISDSVRSAIRRRMAPDSLLRKRIRSAVALPTRLWLEPLLLTAYGSAFLGERLGFISNMMSKNTKRVFPMDNYQLSVAKRTH